MLFSAIKCVALVAYEVKNDLEIFYILRSKIAVAFFVFFRLKYLEFFFVKTDKRLIHIKHGRYFAHSIVHFAYFAFFIRHVQMYLFDFGIENSDFGIFLT